MADLVADLHGRLLRRLAAHMDQHFAGLTVASRAAHRRGLINNKIAKKLKQVDDAFNVLRHITAPSVAGLLAELNGLLVDTAPEEVDFDNLKDLKDTKACEDENSVVEVPEDCIDLKDLKAPQRSADGGLHTGCYEEGELKHYEDIDDSFFWGDHTSQRSADDGLHSGCYEEGKLKLYEDADENSGLISFQDESDDSAMHTDYVEDWGGATLTPRWGGQNAKRAWRQHGPWGCGYAR